MNPESPIERLDTLQPIELAEGVEVRLRIAGPLLRGWALLIDLIFMYVAATAVGMVIGLFGFFGGFMVAMGLQSIFAFIILWWYPVFFEASPWGATPGKKLLGLRVVQTSGSPITIGQSILRSFLRFADGMPFVPLGLAGVSVPIFLVATAFALGTKRFQRLGDLAAGTVVVYDKIPPEPTVPGPPALNTQPPPASLRPDEVKAIIAFKDRAGLWSEGRRTEIAEHARELTGTAGNSAVSRLIEMAHWLQQRK